MSEPLYKDKQFMVDYHPNLPGEHILSITESGYMLQNGILRELARTQRGGIEQKINAFNYEILAKIKKEKIGINELHIVLCQAQLEEEERMRIESQE